MQYINQMWILRHRPSGSISAEDLEWVESPVTGLKEAEVLVRNLYLSLDPTNRLWMSDREQYLPPVGLGDVMRGSSIGVVEATASEKFKVGDIVMLANGGWQLYCVTSARQIHRVAVQPSVPLSAWLSVLGPTGLTAYWGLLDVGLPRAGETLVISAAAGAVGSIVGQIGKLKGCRVIGIAGGAAKCNWLVDELGFDGAIDYKSEDVGMALDRLCPDGIDINFENVGGKIMDEVFARMRKNGRMVLCGMISNYNREGPMSGPTDFGRVLMQRLTICGFIVMDYFAQSSAALTELSQWIADGKIKWKDHVIDDLRAAPEALQRLFSGNHDGKLMVRISE